MPVPKAGSFGGPLPAVAGGNRLASGSMAARAELSLVYLSPYTDQEGSALTRVSNEPSGKKCICSLPTDHPRTYAIGVENLERLPHQPPEAGDLNGFSAPFAEGQAERMSTPSTLRVLASDEKTF